MQEWVENAIRVIGNYANTPESAMRSAVALSDAIINGRVEDWLKVYGMVTDLPAENRARGMFMTAVLAHSNEDLDAAQQRYEFSIAFRRMYGSALYEWKLRDLVFPDIDHIDPTYWQRRDGDLSQAAVEAEEEL